MASGTIDLTSTGAEQFTLRLGWSETPNAAGNSSTVAITSCRIKSTLYGGTWYMGGTIKIGGQTVLSASYYAPATHRVILVNDGKWYDVADYLSGKALPWSTGAIAHNADGSKSVGIATDLELWQDNSTLKAAFSGSRTVTLDKLSGTGGLVFIDNGSGWDDYRAYIDNGTGWDPYVSYIDTGSGWAKY